MASNFNLARSIFLTGEELVTLLSELKPTKFAFTVLNSFVNVVSSSNSTVVKVGMISGFTSTSSSSSSNNNNNNSNTVLVHSYLHNNNSNNSTTIAETDIGLVIEFGDMKETVKLSSIQPKGTLSQNDHGLFIQRCSSSPNPVSIPSAEQIVEIRNRIAHGREANNNNEKSSFATWKIVERESGGANSRRDRGDQQNNNNTSSTENETLVARFQDRRVSKLQSQLSEQLSSLSQARNEIRSLESEVARLTNELKQQQQQNANNNNQQQQQQQASSVANSGASSQQATMIAKLATTVSTLTQRCSQLTGQVDDLVSAGSSRFKCEPTVQAVMDAMLK